MECNIVNIIMMTVMKMKSMKMSTKDMITVKKLQVLNMTNMFGYL